VIALGSEMSYTITVTGRLFLVGSAPSIPILVIESIGDTSLLELTYTLQSYYQVQSGEFTATYLVTPETLASSNGLNWDKLKGFYRTAMKVVARTYDTVMKVAPVIIPLLTGPKQK